MLLEPSVEELMVLQEDNTKMFAIIISNARINGQLIFFIMVFPFKNKKVCPNERHTEKAFSHCRQTIPLPLEYTEKRETPFTKYSFPKGNKNMKLFGKLILPHLSKFVNI